MNKEQIENLGRNILRITLRKEDPKKIRKYIPVRHEPTPAEAEIRKRIRTH